MGMNIYTVYKYFQLISKIFVIIFFSVIINVLGLLTAYKALE